MPTADLIRHTASSEYSNRSMAIDTLQIHHATAFTAAAVLSLMQPGGRTVSANYVLDTDGTLIEVVPVSKRAFTSASAYDHRSITVETVNTSGAPDWGISDASHRRLAQLAREMDAEFPGFSIDRAHIIGHNETPGSYATACPGPSMNLNRITELALGGSTGDEDMGILYTALSESTDKVIPKGMSLIQDDSGSLRPLSSLEYGAYQYWAGKGIPVRRAEWGGDEIRKLTRSVGLAEWVGFPAIPGDNVPVLTGRIVQGDPTKPEYPRVAGGGGSVNPKDVAAAILADPNFISGIAAAVKVSTPAEIAKATNDDAARRLSA